jgi:hypothetical protein
VAVWSVKDAGIDEILSIKGMWDAILQQISEIRVELQEPIPINICLERERRFMEGVLKIPNEV